MDLGQPVGHEAAFGRPAVVVSTGLVNNGPGGLVAVVPISSRSYGLRSQVELQAGSSGLGRTSFARCDQVRVVSTKRLAGHRGMLGADELRFVDRALRFILGL